MKREGQYDNTTRVRDTLDWAEKLIMTCYYSDIKVD